ncbi:MAG: hypothetical protein LBS69_01240 [Prevotellaceae bacterium]|jgi:hypothetical protein|nr:hypothetical protein [Prevotellaceae bacterium]
MESKFIIKHLAFIAIILGCFLCSSIQAQSTDEIKKPNPKPSIGKTNPKPSISKTNPKPTPDNTVSDDELMKQEQRRQDSINQVIKDQRQKEKQEAELIITDMFFSATNTNKKKKMNKDSWVTVNDIVIKEDGIEIGRLNTKVNQESIVNKKISDSYGYVVKFKPAAKTISITFKVTYNIERNSSSPLSLFKDHVNTVDKAKYIEFKFNDDRQEWEVSHIDKQANSDDIPFKRFVIKENAAYQNIDFQLNYIFRTIDRTY